MTSTEDNETLTRVGPGTPMGEVLRRFWMPGLLSSELPVSGGDPVRVRLLGEDMIAFRSDDGAVAMMHERCPHRLASLFYGRCEDGGIRCAYHGWKFAADGTCVDIPNERTGETFKRNIRQPAYPTYERAGLVWVYMGPEGTAPAPPRFGWTEVPDDHRFVAKWYHDSNWLQGLEGEIDSSHISYLHSTLDASGSASGVATLAKVDDTQDRAPRIMVEKTPYGMVSAARRNTGSAEGRYWWRLTHWILPNFSLVPSPAWPMGGRVFVPIDDERSWAFSYLWHPERALTDEELAVPRSGKTFPPRLMDGSFLPLANAGNDYLIDRQAQRAGSYTGIWGINDQDRAVQESMGPIVDRSLEHLGPSDLAVITARRSLLAAARALQAGEELPCLALGGAYSGLRAVDTTTDTENMADLLRERAVLETARPAAVPSSERG